MESRHGGVLKQKLAERRQELLEQLAGGLTQEGYWTVVGQIDGLADAARLSEDADSQLSGAS